VRVVVLIHHHCFGVVDQVDDAVAPLLAHIIHS
jgi:hypothetical protein